MSLPVFELNNEIALITGGGTGLGLAMASCFVQAGAKVVLLGRREEKLRNACEELGNAASYEVFDICRFDETGPLVDRIATRVGPPSILVNNAGNHLKKPAIDTTIEEFEGVFRTHVLAAHALSSRAARHDRAQARQPAVHRLDDGAAGPAARGRVLGR